MSLNKFDTGLGRRIAQAKKRVDQRRADSAPTAPWVTFISEGVGLFADVGAWITAKARGFNIVHMRVIDPPTSSDAPLPPRVARTHVEPAAEERRSVAAAPVVPARPDPFPHLRGMTREQLTVYGFNAMPNAEREELERELNARIRAARNPPPRVDPVELERQLKAAQPKPWWWRS